MAVQCPLGILSEHGTWVRDLGRSIATDKRLYSSPIEIMASESGRRRLARSKWNVEARRIGSCFVLNVERDLGDEIPFEVHGQNDAPSCKLPCPSHSFLCCLLHLLLPRNNGYILVKPIHQHVGRPCASPQWAASAILTEQVALNGNGRGI